MFIPKAKKIEYKASYSESLFLKNIKIQVIFIDILSSNLTKLERYSKNINLNYFVGMK